MATAQRLTTSNRMCVAPASPGGAEHDHPLSPDEFSVVYELASLRIAACQAKPKTVDQKFDGGTGVVVPQRGYHRAHWHTRILTHFRALAQGDQPVCASHEYDW